MNTQNKRILLDSTIKPKHPTKEDYYIKDCIEQGLFLDNKAIEFFDLYPEKIKDKPNLYRKYIVSNDFILAIFVQKTDSMFDIAVDIRFFRSISCFLYHMC